MFITSNNFLLSDCRNVPDFTTLATTSILPADLNAFILKVCLEILMEDKQRFVKNYSDEISCVYYFRWNLTFSTWQKLQEIITCLRASWRLLKQGKRQWSLFFGLKQWDSGLIIGSVTILARCSFYLKQHFTCYS